MGRTSLDKNRVVGNGGLFMQTCIYNTIATFRTWLSLHSAFYSLSLCTRPRNVAILRSNFRFPFASFSSSYQRGGVRLIMH